VVQAQGPSLGPAGLGESSIIQRGNLFPIGEGLLQCGPDLDRILPIIPDIDSDLRGHAGDEDASCLERLVHPLHILLPIPLPLLELLGGEVTGLGSRFGRAGLYTSYNHPKLGHHQGILDLVNPETIVGAIKLRKLVQIGVRHVESDGLVVDGLDGLCLGQVLVDGPNYRDDDSRILGDGGKEGVQKTV